MAYIAKNKITLWLHGGQQGRKEEIGAATLVSGTVFLDSALSKLDWWGASVLGTTVIGTAKLVLTPTADTNGKINSSGGGFVLSSTDLTETATYTIRLIGV